jgi:hypothetical protein
MSSTIPNTESLEDPNKETFVEFNKSKTDKTSVWFYFLRATKGQSAQYKIKDCGKILKTAGGSTSSLRAHLKSKHAIELGSNELSTVKPKGKMSFY